MKKILKVFIICLISQLATFSLFAGSDGSLEIKNKAKGQDKEVKDCFETVNRGIFAFNQGLDKVFFKPIAKGYRYLPKPIRSGTSNALGNLSNVVTIPNNILQGQFKEAGINTLRLSINTTLEAIESIYTAPDVFVTSKIKPSVNFEGDRGNILMDFHEVDKKMEFSVGGMLRDLPGLSSQGLGNATRPLIRGMSNSRVKILQNSSSLSDVSEFGEDHIVAYDPMLIDKIEIIKGPATLPVSYTHLTLPTTPYV